ncbi:MAG: sulfurtransferase [Rhodospirillaceae bacterium]|nr:sulfurtransferase [Rhodospirillaceae bacterium]|tara:strand:+ start:1631 stop:2098 length:468 start_codon:yes stop_codon:yes gene_type:complete
MGQSSESGVTTDGQAFSVGYAGDVDVLEAWEGVKNNPSAVLVDVRTTAEWNFVGTPDLSGAGREPVLIEWQVFPTMDVNASFVDAVIAASPDKSQPIYFLCRSGVRSKSAAMALTQAGYAACFNISEGFEGPHDQNRHRGSSAGWKASGLPWVQG